MMKILKQFIFASATVLALAFAVSAQKQDPPKTPPKDPPPKINPGDKPKPPRDNPPKGGDKPKKPDGDFALLRREHDIA